MFKMKFGFLFSSANILFLVMLLRQLMVNVAGIGSEGLYFDFIGQDCQVLRLKCEVEVASSYGEVVSITIFNMTHTKSKMAYVSTNKQPTSATTGHLKKSLFLSGGVSRPTCRSAVVLWLAHSARVEGQAVFTSVRKSMSDLVRCVSLARSGSETTGHLRCVLREKHKNPVLRILLLHYISFTDQTFVCDATILKEGTEIETRTWNVTINKTVETTPAPKPTSTTTSKQTDSAAKARAIKDGESNSFLDTDSLPMTVLIVMLVLISIVLFIAVFLLMHRYRSRCLRRDEELYRPPAYCLAPDHLLDWSDNGSTLKSKGSARTLNSRSHYSFAAHNMPLPAIPTSATVGRRTRTSRRPPSVNSSVKVQYIQPQDAIGQESSEDGEIAALSSGSPTVHYKTPRDRHSRQNSPLYACVPVSSTDE